MVSPDGSTSEQLDGTPVETTNITVQQTSATFRELINNGEVLVCENVRIILNNTTILNHLHTIVQDIYEQSGFEHAKVCRFILGKLNDKFSETSVYNGRSNGIFKTSINPSHVITIIRGIQNLSPEGMGYISNLSQPEQ